tara:strand:+ start:38662 stop:39633 length:972 start_codon:yes stop_codon:yes gene_type:complete
LKKLLRIFRNYSFVNAVGRGLIKSSSSTNYRISQRLKLFWPVSGTVLIKKKNFSFKLKSEGNDALSNKLYYEANWEDETIYLLKALVPKAKVFFDVGANIGVFSLLAEQFNPNTTIYCFEPNPINVNRIKANLIANNSKNTNLVSKAIGEKKGQLEFYVPNGNYTSDVSSFYNAHTKDFNDFGTKAINVEVISLDEFVLENKEAPDLIKMDIELFEYQALKGSLNLLREENPVIIIELFNDVVKRAINPALNDELEKDLTLKTEKLLADLGYHFYLISTKGLLHIQNLTSNADSSMYLLTKEVLSKTFYLQSEYEELSNELFH